MNVELTIVGGHLEVDRGVFAREMLRPESRLRGILQTANLAQKPRIVQNPDRGTCTVDFNHSAEIPLAENYQEVFRSLKADYGDRIRGKLTLRVTTLFNCFITAFNLDGNEEMGQ